MRPIQDIGERLGIRAEYLIPYGHTKAKVSLDYIESLKDRPDGKLILVTAITPTPAGEGKTTTTVGLGDGLNRIGKRAVVCLREPSLGPCFGMKGRCRRRLRPDRADGRYQPALYRFPRHHHRPQSPLGDDRQPHLWGNELGIDSRASPGGGCSTMNDRALREIVCSLGGVANGYPARPGSTSRSPRRSWPFSALRPRSRISSGVCRRSSSPPAATRARSSPGI